MLDKFASSRIIALSYGFFTLLGCTQAPPATPMCRVAENTLQQTQGNAGCIVRIGSQLLTITHRLSGKLDIPGGTAQADESAQCTAHRETFEETGFNVEVGKKLGEKDDFVFYACRLSGDFTGEITQFPVPEWAESEVSAISLQNPFALEHHQWRYSDELEQLRGMFNQVGQISTEQPSPK
ncbi:NUDIX hydrolase [Neptunicella marina]|uniref:NUDIX hydrolase n=1 Tax=Neptunicella marina TaxID=2125989 RepID=A0A8J6IS54_9ALTE|nr:NUDIX hydrolase [Neptunicella marina]MBC3764852.1 NUDIX hydrolase [Neptunicella marina]